MKVVNTVLTTLIVMLEAFLQGKVMRMKQPFCACFLLVCLIATQGFSQTVRLTGGSVNGESVQAGTLEITADLGASITGTVSTETVNSSVPSNVAPYVLVWNWGSHDSSFAVINPWISTGTSTFDVDIDLTAPEVAGTYYITLAWELEMTGAQVASLTNWRVDNGNAHWDDGYDIADWDDIDYTQTQIDHFVTTNYEGSGGWGDRDVPAAMIRVTVSPGVGVYDDISTDLLPISHELAQNYPNPFNPSTTIEYYLPHRSHVLLSVHNLLGQKIVTLVDGVQSYGPQSVQWNGRDSQGLTVGSGVYFYRIKTDGFTESRKMLLLK